MATISTERQMIEVKAGDVAKIRNELVESFVRQNNLTAFKILFYVARVNFPTPAKDIALININTSDLCKYCQIDLKTLKRNIKQMTQTSISIIDEKSESYITLIPKARFVIGTNKLELTIFREILELIWQVEKRFTVIDVKEVMMLNSKHSIRMIQLLEMIDGFGKNVAKRKSYSLKELNLMFGTDYKKVADFERFVLIPVKEELDANSKLSFVYQIIFTENPAGRGRPIADKINIDLIKNIPQDKS